MGRNRGGRRPGLSERANSKGVLLVASFIALRVQQVSFCKGLSHDQVTDRSGLIRKIFSDLLIEQLVTKLAQQWNEALLLIFRAEGHLQPSWLLTASQKEIAAVRELVGGSGDGPFRIDRQIDLHCGLGLAERDRHGCGLHLASARASHSITVTFTAIARKEFGSLFQSTITSCWTRTGN